ncbi:MAG: hypothetical protein A3F14_06485 [Gammaproteobacteria bacterium RIFCSPHIGHO2_12_FULL_43_28]|nr:MAG: hypothetical protein A3F14_06485 [Gammaproteobacteria bacterium RIFCSPHIGHO2_12_FULL_43_28]
MAIRDILKISRKTYFNPKGWIDYEALKYQNRTILTILKDLFTPATPTHQETFEEAIARFGLKEEEIEDALKTYRAYAFLFLMLGILAFIYAFYLLFRYTSFSGWLLSLAVTGLFCAQSFKYDFWAFQIKRRKLGATFSEWKNHLLNKGPSMHD